MTVEVTRPQPEHISISEVTKRFVGMTALDNISLDIEYNDFTLITGPSGSGKTTLLNVMSGIMRPDNGTVSIGGQDITSLSNQALTRFRSFNGQAFQRSGLMAGFSARENIMNPHILAGNTIDPAWTGQLCERLNILKILDQPASSLSGGQALRVSLVRALAQHPKLVFADEPTAALDSTSKIEIYDMLESLTYDNELGVVMVSHDPASQEYADRIIYLKDGAVESDKRQ